MRFNPLKEFYKKPFGAVECGERVVLRFPFDSWVPVDRVWCVFRLGNRQDRVEMRFSENRNDANVFECAYTPNAEGIYFYRFEMQNSDGLWHYGKDADKNAICGEFLPEWQLTVTKTGFKTPDALKGGLIYHIFADRFCKGKGVIPARNYRMHESWSEEPIVIDGDGTYRADDFFGGNFQGIIDKLDYLKALGVTAIYLSPIFEAASNHRYDTGDYMKVDSLLGTESDYKRLVKKAKDRGISLILDGVFNHSGADSVYFNKFGRYDSVGACQSKSSPYYGWYNFSHYPDGYDCWWGVTVVPNFNEANPAFREFIAGGNGVVGKWTKTGIGGWRLDVVDELPIDFTYEICAAVKQENPDAVIIGEVWEDATTKVSYGTLRPYLLGGQLDGVMNYPFKRAILECVKGGSAAEFRRQVMEIVENYPKPALDCCMTLIDSHDTVRAVNELAEVSLAGADKVAKSKYRLSYEQYSKGKYRLKRAAVLQYTLPGVPSLYYGDEAGIQGFEDPINRRPYPWDNPDAELIEFYQKLGAIRGKYRDCLTGGIEFIESSSLISFKRLGRARELTVIYNNSANTAVFDFSDGYVNLIDGLAHRGEEVIQSGEYGIYVPEKQRQ